MSGVVNVFELEPLARACLTASAYAYLAGGSGDEHTLRWNVDSWARIRLAPHVLVDVGATNTRLHLLGHDLAAPILLAPTAAHRLFHPGGEGEALRRAGRGGSSSTSSGTAASRVSCWRGPRTPARQRWC